ncbi:MAG: outer membrane protein transport protein [Desulforegulaceae bacterium]|nr:outer membrane protein transport protein [Desulforegulaceae bacterium]
MRKLIFSLLIIMIFFSYTNVYANCVDTFGIGSKATAMGGAYSAYANDPFAAYYNPAGLTQIESMSVAIGSAFMDPNLKAKGYKVKKDNSTIMGPKDFRDESDVLAVPHLGFAMPINSKIAFGIAAYAPFGLHLKWDDTNDPTTNPAAYNSYESWYTRFVVNPTIAYKFSDKFSFGFGVAIGRSESGTYKNSYDLYQSGITGAIEGDLTDEVNYSWNVGVMYKPVETVTIGLTYRSRADAEFEGDLELKNLSQNEKNTLNSVLASNGLTDAFENNDFKSKIELGDVDHPSQVQFGLRYAPNDRLSIEGDFVWTNWSNVEQQTVIIKDPYIQALLGTDREIYPRNWESTRQIKVGIEYLLNDMFTFRCGYYYDPSPIPDSTFDIVWSDADKKSYSVGLGVNLGSWTIDGSFQYIKTEMDREVGGESVNLNHSYGEDSTVYATAEGKIYGYSMTASYKF